VATLIDPGTGQVFEVDDSEADLAARQNNLRPATPEEVDAYDAEKRSGGFGDQVLNVAEEAGRKVVSGVQAIGRGLGEGQQRLLDAAAPGAVPGVGLADPATGLPVPMAAVADPEGKGSDIVPELYDAPSLERRAVNPTSTAIGGALPAVAAGLALPGAGWAGAAATVGTDVLDAAAQEALDAELEGRDIRGEDVARNAGLNLLFSGGAAGLGVLGRQALRAGRSTLDMAAEMASRRLQKRAAGAAGKDLVDAVADPEVAAQHATDLSNRAVTLIEEAEQSLAAPGRSELRVANNPNAQRAAIETLSDAFGKTAGPDVAKRLESLQKASGAARFQGLRQVRAGLEAGDPLAEAIDQTLSRGELWGDDALRAYSAREAASSLRPGADATPEQLQAYAEALSAIPSQAKRAEALSSLIEEGNQARIAATIPRKPPTSDEAAKLVQEADKAKLKIRDTVVGPRADRGALQEWTDQFSKLVSNAEKRETFVAFENSMAPEAREALGTEARKLAEASKPIVDRLPETAQARVKGFIDALQESGSAADLDRLKNAFQALRKRYASVSNDVRAADYVEAIDEVEPGLRKALEDPKFVGEKTASIQRARNEAWSNPEGGFIRSQNRMKAAGFNLHDVVEMSYDGRAVIQTDAKAFETLLSAPPDQALKALNAWSDQLQAARKIVGTVVGSADGATAKFNATTGKLLNEIEALRRLKLAEDAVARTAAPGLGARAVDAVARRAATGLGTAAGALIGGPVGAAVGAGAGAVIDGAMAGGGGMRAVRQAFDGATDKALTALAGMRTARETEARWTARLMVNPDQAGRYLRVAGDIGSALARFQGDHESPAEAFEEYRTQLEKFRDRPEMLIDMLADEYEDVGGLSPRLQREIIGQATRVTVYLQNHLPGRRNVSVVYPKGTGASRMEVRHFALRFTAATDPSSVMADARAGRLERVQVETLQELWPREYETLRLAALEELGKGKPTTNTRQRLSLLFNFGSGVDPALGARTRAVVMAARAAQESKASSQPSPSASQRQSLPSKAGLTPGGIASLQLGQSLTF
jgi:hypothetical protein